MGFLAGYHGLGVSLLLNFALAFKYIKNAIYWIISWIVLANPLQRGSSWALQFSEVRSAISSVSADMIRERLPLSTFRDFAERYFETEEDITCSVCLCSFDGDDEIRELCNCRHIFHRNCLDKWIDHHQKSCPLCRSPLLPETERLDTKAENEELWAVDRISYLFAEDLIDSWQQTHGTAIIEVCK